MPPLSSSLRKPVHQYSSSDAPLRIATMSGSLLYISQHPAINPAPPPFCMVIRSLSRLFKGRAARTCENRDSVHLPFRLFSLFFVFSSLIARSRADSDGDRLKGDALPVPADLRSSHDLASWIERSNYSNQKITNSRADLNFCEHKWKNAT